MLLGDISLNDRQQRSVAGESLVRAARQGRAIEQRHIVPAREQGCGDIDPDETGAAKDQDFQMPALASAFSESHLGSDRFHSKLAPKFRAGSISATSRPVGFAASPPERARKRPEPGSAVRLPSATITRPRDSTVTGQPRSLRPA